MQSRIATVTRYGTVLLCVICWFQAPAQNSIVINEIHYNPDIKTEPAEFIELYNAGTNTVNMAGWFFSGALNYVFPATNVAPAGYVVVAQNPTFLNSKYQVTGALGPLVADMTSRLGAFGDDLVLRNASSNVVDEVHYKLGFPWPIVGDTPGYSIELINPSLDNDLGGSWRASVNVSGPTVPLISSGSAWKYHKGTAEASSPTAAWRALAFDDSAWSSGVLPIGYEPILLMNTPLNDMNSNYCSLFLRKTFVVDDLAAIKSLLLEIMYDDGFKLWINGSNVLNAGMPPGEVPFDALAIGPARESANYDRFVLTQITNYLRAGTNVIALQVHNIQLTNEDFFVDLRLAGQIGASAQGPTPGKRNSVYANNAPPQIRQLEVTPEQPKAGDTVKISAKVTDPDGVAAVILEYQTVDPGSYIELTDAAYTNNWVAVPMNDEGIGGDYVADDSIYSVDLPSSVQTNRRLVRYRITVTDTLGNWVRMPYVDDPQPNFAYFVYDGVPAWSGAIRPGAGGNDGQIFSVTSNAMSRLPVYQLIAKSNTVATATWFSRYRGDLYQWAGTLVYDGKVYDHIHYRARGGVWRYSMCKNMWKFDMNRGHDLEARDDWGRKFSVPWRKLNLGACIQQGSYNHRGEQGMFESVGSKLFRLAGVQGFKTTFVTMRIIDDALESNASNQYEGDWWGLYLALEQEDGRFLDEHGLPDSNYYKMEGGTGELNNTAPNGPVNKSDLNYILNNYASQSEAWWRTNWNLSSYYGYQTIIQAIHHYDINADKNFFYYYDPRTHLWEVMPWDLDLTWAHNMFNSPWGGLNKLASYILKATSQTGTGSQSGTSNIRLSGASDRANFEREFRNRVREVRDLLFNTDQAWKIIDENAWLVRGPTGVPSIIDADRCQWDWNPKMASSSYSDNTGQSGQGKYYQFPGESGTNASLKGSFDATIQIMKNYVGIRSEHLDSLALDTNIPSRPVITYTGPSNYPINRLTFRCSNFSSPTTNTFGSLRWRVGEVSDYNVANYDPSKPWKYEIETVWDSGPISVFTPDVTIPGSVLRVGSRYRVRAQFCDSTGRNSNWSLPIEFTCGANENLADLMNYLRITEVMYHEAPGGYEYIELHNFSPTVTLDLGGVRFTDGIDFGFTNGTLIPPGGYLLVIGTQYVNLFRAFYGLDDTVPIVWAYTGALNNAGEQLTLKTSEGGSNIVSFTYGDGRGWPQGADGYGHSLVLLDSAVANQGDGSGEYGPNWRASTFMRGSPGQADPVLGATLLLNEIAANTTSTNVLGSDDWIELYNPTDSPLTLDTNWFLSDDPASLKKWTLPSNTIIPAKGFVSFDEETGFHWPTNTGFGISKSGEQIFLSYLPGTAEDRVVDCVTFKAQEAGWSLGRYPDAGANWYALTPTRGTNNAVPGLHLVINELLYHPPDIGGTNDNTLDEFVELFNPTDAPVPLWNSNGTWRLSGGISINFPTNLVLGPGAYMLAVNFNPVTNLTQLALFKALYGITDDSLVIIGPYSGKLNNSSDRVALDKPQYDLPGSPAWVIVDEVIYLDQAPWPCGSDGTGASLQRVSALEHGNNPANWSSQAPTPGLPRVPIPVGAPTIVAQPVSQRVPVDSTVMFLVNVCGTPPYTYQWWYNDQPIPSANSDMLILPAVVSTNAGRYWVVVSNSAGETVSTVATLELYYVPVNITRQPLGVTLKGSSVSATYGQTGSNFTFFVAANGTKPISYQWYHDGVAIPGAIDPSLSFTNASLNDEGTYIVAITNIVGGVVSLPAQLRITVDPAIRQQPAHQTVVTGSVANFTVIATGHPMPLGYRWKRDGASVANGYFYINSTNCTLTITNAASNNAGGYTVTITNSAESRGPISSSAYLTAVIPPTNLTVNAGGTAGFRITAFCGTSTTRLRYQWQLNGVSLDGAITNTLALTNVTIAQQGTYTVFVTNPANYAESFSADLTVIALSDTDGDGMPDLWELAHGLNPQLNDAADDADHDGMTNLQEYLAGTDPNDPRDLLHLDIVKTNNILLQFTAKSNKTYRIEYKNPLSTNVWESLVELPSAPTNRLLQQTDQLGASNRFYRISLPTAP